MKSFPLIAALAASLFLSSSAQAIEGTPKANALANMIVFNAEVSFALPALDGVNKQPLLDASMALASFIKTIPDDALPIWLADSRLDAPTYETIAQCVAEGAALPPHTPLMDDALTAQGYLPAVFVGCSLPAVEEDIFLQVEASKLKPSLFFLLLKPADGQYILMPDTTYPLTRWVLDETGKGYFTAPDEADFTITTQSLSP